MTQPGTTPDPNIPSVRGTDKILVDLEEASFRMQILCLVHDPEVLPDEVIKRAKRYYNWLTKPENGIVPPVVP